MRRAMVTGGETATAPARMGGALRLVPAGALKTALTGTAIAFAALALVENAATAATGAAVVACTLLVSESLLRRPRPGPCAGEPLSLPPPEQARGAVEVSEVEAAAFAPAGAALGAVEAKLAALCDYVEKLPDLFAIMKEHTRNVIADTERASYSFVDNLGEIDRKIKALKDFLLASQQDRPSI